RRAVGFVLSIQRAVLVLLDGPLDIMRYKQIQLAVVVIIEPYCAGGESRICHTRFRGYVGELSIAKIVEEMIVPNCGDIDVFITIVVIVANRASQTVCLDRQAGLPGHIGEGAILIIMVESGSGLA